MPGQAVNCPDADGCMATVAAPGAVATPGHTYDATANCENSKLKIVRSAATKRGKRDSFIKSQKFSQEI
jgi:hypothetical protein